jgi:F-type H+-transporting ATPase subunit epsilon
MKDTLKLSILTPDRVLFRGEIKELITENELGRMSILPNHVAMICSLVPAVTTFVEENNNEKKVFSSSGVLKVNENEIEMLCETAEWPDEIDIERAEASKKKAEEILDTSNGHDNKRAELKLRRSIMRILAKS